jgi:putative aldouronate transport system permease protein
MTHTVKSSGLKLKGGGFLYIRNNYWYYLMMIPALTYIIGYKFVPLFGLIIAFKDFSIFLGDTILDSILQSPWVGLHHFTNLFGKPDFLRVFSNTLIISLYKIIILFPIPVAIAILLNELGGQIFKRTVQTVIYLPHFLSWVVVFGIFYSLLSSDGIINTLLNSLGGKRILFFMDMSLFRGLLVVTDGWKEAGWGTVVYLAAITGINEELYEAAAIDGANRFKRIIHITIPEIMPVIALMLIMRVGKILEAGFEQVLIMYNPTVYQVGDIIQTYIYRIGIGQMNYSQATAFGLFDSIVAFILVVSSNMACKKMLGKSIW